MSIDITALKYFRSVARLGNFSRASDQLNVSQSAISRQVKLLEDSLQVTLFDRTSRGVDLTEAGRVLLERAEQIIDLVEKLKHDVSAANECASSHLNIGFPTSLGRLLVSPIIADLSSEFDNAEFFLFEGFSDEVSALVSQEKLTMGIVSKPPINDRLTATPIFKEQIWLWGIPEHWTLGKRPLVPSQLTGLPLVSTRLTSSMMTVWLAAHGVAIGRTTEADSQAALYDLAMANIGYIVAPRSSCLDDYQAARLTGLPIEGLYMPRFIIERRNTRHSKIAEQFLANLMSRVDALAEGGARLLERV